MTIDHLGSFLTTEGGPPFADQVKTDVYLSSIFYMICGVAIVAGIVGLAVIDSGICRRKNRLDTVLQKMIASLIAASSFLVVGFGIWMWQYYDAFGYKNPLKAAVADWWIGGDKMT